MNVMKKVFALACMAVFAAVGCQEEAFEGRMDPDNYFVSVETFGSDTRTALGEGRSVVWSEEDRIAIFEGNGAGQAYQVLDAYVGKSSAEFAPVEGLMTGGTAEALDGTVAVYPFDESITVAAGAEGTFTISGIEFPSEQIYAAGSFADEAFPMAGLSASASRNLSFKNIGGVIRLSLTGDYSVSRITLKGNSGEPLSGSATVTLGQDGIPSVTISDDASTSVSLLCDPAVQLDPEKATDFYISIPPTEFEAGFTVTVTDSEGADHSKSTERQNTVRRSRILVMPMLGSDDFSIMKLAGNAKVYDEEKTDYFKSVESGKIVIDPSMAEEDIPQVGEIIICPATEKTPNGYIGKVVSAETTASGIEVQTEVVPLNEAFEELHISTAIDMAPYIESVEDGDGNELDFRMVPDSEWPQDDLQTRAEFSKPLNFAVTIEEGMFKGSVYQNNLLKVNIDISWFKIKRFDATIEKKSGVKGEWEMIGLETEELKKTLGELKVKMAAIPIPSTPIIIVPALYTELFFESKAEVSLTSELGIVLEHQLYRFSYNNGDPVSESIDLLTGPKAYFQCISLDAKGEMALGLSGGVNVAFWDEAALAFGTEVTVKGTVGIEADISMEDNLLESNVKATLTPSVTSTVYAESALFKPAGFDEGRISKEFDLAELEELEIYALPRFSKIEKDTEDLKITAAADVDKLSLIWCREKGFALFEKDGETALEHIAFDNPEPDITTNRDTVVFTLPSAEKEYIAKPYVLAFGKYFYMDEDDRWVDLGLPSGILWAAYNVGASSPEEYGGYYAWGETEEKESYTWENYQFYKSYDRTNDLIYFDYIGTDISNTIYDAASCCDGSGARLPTVSEIKELINYCSHENGTYNNVRGKFIIGNNGNKIFLPLTGHKEYEDIDEVGEFADYWSSSQVAEEFDTQYVDAYVLCCRNFGVDFERQDTVGLGYRSRHEGHPIRPVKDKQ